MDPWRPALLTGCASLDPDLPSSVDFPPSLAAWLPEPCEPPPTLPGLVFAATAAAGGAGFAAAVAATGDGAGTAPGCGAETLSSCDAEAASEAATAEPFTGAAVTTAVEADPALMGDAVLTEGGAWVRGDCCCSSSTRGHGPLSAMVQKHNPRWGTWSTAYGAPHRLYGSTEINPAPASSEVACVSAEGAASRRSHLSVRHRSTTINAWCAGAATC